jgi:tetratricopeptide (TPR) repeat protein
MARTGLNLPDKAGQRGAIRNFVTLALAGRHEGATAQDSLRLLVGLPGPVTGGRFAVTRFQLEGLREDWKGVLALAPLTEQIIVAATSRPVTGNPFDRGDLLAVVIHPWVALAKAKTGDLAGAQALIVTTPGDCYICVGFRGLIAAETRQWGRADCWFAKAVHDGPSLPFAETNWGSTLLQRGKADAAIEKFTLANRKSPHFADPLEGWGEALMAKNQSHLALAKFEEADKYAPNWGRLHLKWGEALYYADKKDEAQKQFALAPRST